MANEPRRDIVVIGASAGGIQAIRSVLNALTADVDAAIFVVLHMGEHAPGLLPAVLQRDTPLPVATARDRMPIQHGRITIAPPGHHLLLQPNGVHLSQGPRASRHRPSIDVLFRSAAVAFGPRVIGIVLSGMLDDGTAGLCVIKRHGGMAVAQDPADAEYPDMPRNAMHATQVDACLSSSQIGQHLADWTVTRHSRRHLHLPGWQPT